MFASRSASRAGAALARAPRRLVASSASSDAHADAILRVGADPRSLRALADVLRASGCRPVPPTSATGSTPWCSPWRPSPRAASSAFSSAPRTPARASARAAPRRPLRPRRDRPGLPRRRRPRAPRAHRGGRRGAPRRRRRRPPHRARRRRPRRPPLRPRTTRRERHAPPPGRLRPAKRPRPIPIRHGNLAAAHEAKRDVLSALVTHEWLANEPTFRGWAFPTPTTRARCASPRPRRRSPRRRPRRARVGAVVDPRRPTGVAREMADIAGLAATMRARGWGAAELQRDARDGAGRRTEPPPPPWRGTSTTSRTRSPTPTPRRRSRWPRRRGDGRGGAGSGRGRGGREWRWIGTPRGRWSGGFVEAGMRALAAFVRREDA